MIVFALLQVSFKFNVVRPAGYLRVVVYSYGLIIFGLKLKVNAYLLFLFNSFSYIDFSLNSL